VFTDRYHLPTPPPGPRFRDRVCFSRGSAKQGRLRKVLLLFERFLSDRLHAEFGVIQRTKISVPIVSIAVSKQVKKYVLLGRI
jgi:hypothetical protein